MSFVGPASLKVDAADDFSITGSMNTARTLPTATLLTNGKVLVAGGYDISNSVLSSAELFDPETSMWTNTGSMGAARQRCKAVLLANGIVLVAGGGGIGTTNSSAELYDLATGMWTNTGSMDSARASHTTTLLTNGNVLVAGGYDVSIYPTAELYDPATGLWTNTGSMSNAREDHTAILLPNGKVLVAGGRNGTIKHSNAELFDPETGLWTNTGSMASARYLHTATLLSDGKVLVAGGTNGSTYLSSAELYDPATGLWTSAGSMGAARGFHTATLLSNDKVLVVGGATGGTFLSSAELFTPATGLWTNTGSMASVRISHTASLLTNGKVLVTGGTIGGNNYLSTAELFGPAPIALPIITTQPANVSANLGATATFSVTATGAMSYQWQKFGVNITGATSSALVFNNVQTSNAGSYSVMVSNIDGRVTSENATLSVIVPPAIITNPFNVIANPGENAAFQVTHSGSISTYQWQRNGLDIIGATGVTLSLSDVRSTDVGTYAVLITNQAGSIMSNPATLTLAQGTLYTQEQFNAALQAGIQAGRAQVTDSPNYYGLYRIDQVQALNLGAPLLTKDQLSGKFKLTIRLGKSADLTTFTKFPFTSGEAMINAQGEIEFQFTSPDNAAFFRLETH